MCFLKRKIFLQERSRVHSNANGSMRLCFELKCSHAFIDAFWLFQNKSQVLLNVIRPSE